MPPELDNLLTALPREHIEDASGLGLTLKPGLNLENWSKLVAHLVQMTGRANRNRDTLTAWLGDLRHSAAGGIADRSLSTQRRQGSIRGRCGRQSSFARGFLC